MKVSALNGTLLYTPLQYNIRYIPIYIVIMSLYSYKVVIVTFHT